MGHTQPTTPTVMDSGTGDLFVNENIIQLSSRATDLKFYWFRYRFRQGKFMVYRMAGENNMEDYFTKHHSTSNHREQWITYLVPTAYTSKYA